MPNQLSPASASSFATAKSFLPASSNVGLLKAVSLEDGHLLRASSLESVLNRSGKILKNSAGSADTYSLSREVESIDGFISHNWSTGRVEKFLALAIHFNLCPALFATAAICFVLMLIEYRGILPTIQRTSSVTGESQRRSVSCHVLGSLIFPILLWTWNRIRRILSCMHIRRPVSVFLDKTCIHQTDMALKKKGIQSLAGFIFHSRSMLVVYTDTYLNKLWTVYELASFLSVHGNSTIIFIPTFLSKLFMVAYLCRATGHTLAMLMLLKQETAFSAESKMALSEIFKSFSLVPIAIVTRAWAKHKFKLYQKVSLFHISDATCFDESDRPLVYGNIARFMRESGHADPSASESDALLAFDSIVRSKVPRCIKSSLGSTGLPFVYVFAINATGLFKAFDSYSYFIENKTPMRTCLLTFLSYMISLLFIWPLAVELTCCITRVGLDTGRFCDYLVLGVAMISGGSFIFVIQTLEHHLNRLSRESDFYLWLMLVVASFLGLAIERIYGRSCLRCRHPSACDTSQPSEMKIAPNVLVEMAEMEPCPKSILV